MSVPSIWATIGQEAEVAIGGNSPLVAILPRTLTIGDGQWVMIAVLAGKPERVPQAGDDVTFTADEAEGWILSVKDEVDNVYGHPGLRSIEITIVGRVS